VERIAAAASVSKAMLYTCFGEGHLHIARKTDEAS
jgi:hypothetical protein